MRIAVFGAGGVGGYFGGRLARAGHEVHFIARGAHLAAIRERGLRIESPAGSFTVSPALATDDPAAVGPVDCVVVGVKAWQIEEAGRAMAPLVGSDTTVLPLLNGVEATEELGRILGPERVLVGLCRIIAEIDAPGSIRHGGIDPTIVLGEADDGPSDRVARLRDALVEAGVGAQVPDDVRVALWEKFMLIATWSGIGAVTRVPIGAWRSVPETRALAEASLREVHAVARARGIRLAEEKVGATMDRLDGVPADGTASMQRDVMAGRPSELEAQNGAVVRLGAASGVATPTHDFIYRSLLPQERAARG